LTDDFDGIEKLANVVAELGYFERVGVLPFSPDECVQVEKAWVNHTLEDMRPPTPEVVGRARFV